MEPCSSSEKRGALDESIQSTNGPSKDLFPSQLVSSPTQRNIKTEELKESSTELQSPDQSEKSAEKKEEKTDDTTQKLGGTCLMTFYYKWCAGDIKPVCQTSLSNQFI